MPLDDSEPIICELPMAPPQLVRPVDEKLADSVSDLMHRQLDKVVQETARAAHERWPGQRLGWKFEWIYDTSYAIRLYVFPVGPIS